MEPDQEQGSSGKAPEESGPAQPADAPAAPAPPSTSAALTAPPAAAPEPAATDASTPAPPEGQAVTPQVAYSPPLGPYDGIPAGYNAPGAMGVPAGGYYAPVGASAPGTASAPGGMHGMGMPPPQGFVPRPVKQFPAALVPGAVKLFVGQIPRSMDESALLPIFEEMGEILELAIIRDRATQTHKGCAFLTYKTKDAAMAAVEKFHDKVALPPMTNSLQVKVADSHDSSTPEIKLFVGHLQVDDTEDSLRPLFEAHGELTEIVVLRDNRTGLSKRSAFVRYKERASADAAIVALNGSVLHPNAEPIVVKYARTKRDKELAKPKHSMQPAYGRDGGFYGDYGGGFDAYGMGQGGYGPGHYGPGHYGGGGPGYYGGGGYGPGGGFPPHPYMHGGDGGRGGYGGEQFPGHDPSHGGFGTYSSDGRPVEGPPGSNLFIYHLPQGLTDEDLANAFSNFGPVISAKVYVDKRTGESRGFGFVSYSDPRHAESAIQGMNGFSLGNKTLKVEHKRTSAPPPRKMPPALGSFGGGPGHFGGAPGLRYPPGPMSGMPFGASPYGAAPYSPSYGMPGPVPGHMYAPPGTYGQGGSGGYAPPHGHPPHSPGAHVPVSQGGNPYGAELPSPSALDGGMPAESMPSSGHSTPPLNPSHGGGPYGASPAVAAAAPPTSVSAATQ